MSKSKKSIGPKEEKSTATLSDWMDILQESGKRADDERRRLHGERSEWIRNYFKEDANRVQDLGPTQITKWTDGKPTLNRRFAENIFKSEKLLMFLWEEIARRSTFDEAFKDMIEYEFGALILADGKTWTELAEETQTMAEEQAARAKVELKG